jgi:hypothetical protein
MRTSSSNFEPSDELAVSGFERSGLLGEAASSGILQFRYHGLDAMLLLFQPAAIRRWHPAGVPAEYRSWQQGFHIMLQPLEFG